MTTTSAFRALFARLGQTMRRAAWLMAGCAAALPSPHGRAADQKSADPDLPQPVSKDAAKTLLESPPFTRMLDLSDTLKLTGIAYVQGKPVATIVNKVTKQSYLVTAEPNAQGWRLAGVSTSPQLRQSEVKIEVGGEIVAIRYSETQVAPSKKSSMPSRIPTPEEFTGHDEKGTYVRGVPYLSDEDRERFRKIPRETRDKFLSIVHDQREMLFKASHEERAAFAKKALDTAEGK
jgi:hypothetical protein